jgi:hypothetical protein
MDLFLKREVAARILARSNDSGFTGVEQCHATWRRSRVAVAGRFHTAAQMV